MIIVQHIQSNCNKRIFFALMRRIHVDKLFFSLLLGHEKETDFWMWPVFTVIFNFFVSPGVTPLLSVRLISTCQLLPSLSAQILTSHPVFFSDKSQWWRKISPLMRLAVCAVRAQRLMEITRQEHQCNTDRGVCVCVNICVWERVIDWSRDKYYYPDLSAAEADG